MVSWTSIDKKILRAFYQSTVDGNKITSWKLMKKVFPKGGNREDKFVKTRLINLNKKGVINYSDREGFSIIKDNIKIDEIPAIKNCISLKGNDDKWEVYES